MSMLPVRIDRTGFPMIWVEAIGAFMHWLPVTKVQFEEFICDDIDGPFDAEQYDTLLGLNPRVGIDGITPDNYWHALLNGILPAEAERFTAWCGEGYTLPTETQWLEAYGALKAWPAEPASLARTLPGLHDQPMALVERIDCASTAANEKFGRERTLADQMLLRFGALDWVRLQSPGARWGGLGEPLPALGLLAAPERGPVLPYQPETVRSGLFGFRLLWSSR